MRPNLLTRAIDRFAGRGSAAVTIPAMDGPLKPNARLEESRALLAIDAPDNLVSEGGRVLFSSGAQLFTLDPTSGRSDPVRRFGSDITALALAPDGTVAVGLDRGDVEFHGGPRRRETLNTVGGQPLCCPSALAFLDAETLLLCQGSARFPASQWQRSVMSNDVSGSVWTIDLSCGDTRCLGAPLAFPIGLLVPAGTETVVVSEAWRHRLVRLPITGSKGPEVVLDNLPGYPARQSAAKDGGSWLAVFAPRSQLIEFVLKEPAFAARMQREIGDPNLWIGPSLSSGKTYLEPLQGGAVKQMGILKPWAPTRSYGLVIRLDQEFLATDSLHSRADGRRHGITSCVEAGATLLSTSRGGGCILETLIEASS